MTAIRVIFDGKAFIPQQPVSLPNQSEALVLVAQDDPAAAARLDAALRAYYQNQSDADDDAWGAATAAESHRAWDETERCQPSRAGTKSGSSTSPTTPNSVRP